jgi:hypothetical protein
MCYYTWQTGERIFSNCGSFSAVFLFPAWLFSIKSLGLIDVGPLSLLPAGRTTPR